MPPRCCAPLRFGGRGCRAWCAVLCCAVLCCAVLLLLLRAVLCCAACCAVLRAVLCCADMMKSSVQVNTEIG